MQLWSLENTTVLLLAAKYICHASLHHALHLRHAGAAVGAAFQGALQADEAVAFQAGALG